MKERVAADFPRTRADLEQLVRIPGCAFPGFPDDEIERACQAVIDIYRAAGFPRVERLDVDGGKPAVLAEVPGLQLVFDTGNPVFNADRDQPAPRPLLHRYRHSPGARCVPQNRDHRFRHRL